MDIAEAKKVQRIMAEKVILEDDFQSCSLIGGMDVSNNLYDPKQRIYASAVVLSDTLEVRELPTRVVNLQLIL
jgi:deoxyribonuclease V